MGFIDAPGSRRFLGDGSIEWAVIGRRSSHKCFSIHQMILPHKFPPF